MRKCCIVSTSVVCTAMQAMQAMCEQRSACILCTKHQHCSYFKYFACVSSHSFALPSSASANWSCLRSIQSVKYTLTTKMLMLFLAKMPSDVRHFSQQADHLEINPMLWFLHFQGYPACFNCKGCTCAAHMMETSDGVATSIEVPERRAGQQLGHGKSRMISQSVAAYAAKAVRLSQIQEAASELCICVNQACFTGDSMGTGREIKPDCVHVYMSSIPSICSNTIYMSYYTF